MRRSRWQTAAKLRARFGSNGGTGDGFCAGRLQHRTNGRNPDIELVTPIGEASSPNRGVDIPPWLDELESEQGWSGDVLRGRREGIRQRQQREDGGTRFKRSTAEGPHSAN
uniref:(northern house mosquito) hypothetical protein n=1 Tax=Culex pipiens TaxID=7175 RepID=A0A8D8C8D8_CULPI